MKTSPLTLAGALSLALALLATPARAAGDASYPVFEESRLAEGRQVWLGTCEGCHGIGVAGAPVATRTDAWAPRVAQGMDTLYAHALEGHYGPRGTMMPPRGGNDSLSDEEVKAAVDYMVRLSGASP